jgi:hypothetical protein
MNRPKNIENDQRAKRRRIPFEVPESYFEEFPERIQNRLQGSRDTRVHRIRPWLAYAAIFVGLITLGYAGFRILKSQESGPRLTSEEINETIEYFAYVIDDEMLISEVLESGIDFSPETSVLQEDEIIQYLSEDEDIDIPTLMIE